MAGMPWLLTLCDKVLPQASKGGMGPNKKYSTCTWLQHRLAIGGNLTNQDAAS